MKLVFLIHSTIANKSNTGDCCCGSWDLFKRICFTSFFHISLNSVFMTHLEADLYGWLFFFGTFKCSCKLLSQTEFFYFWWTRWITFATKQKIFPFSLKCWHLNHAWILFSSLYCMPVVEDTFSLWWILHICASLPGSGLQFTSKFTVMLHRPAATPNFIAVSYCHQNHQIIKLRSWNILC